MNAYTLARQLITEGRSYQDLSRLRRRGELDHLRRGVYLKPADREVDERHRLMIASTHALGDGASVVSFGSAATIHGLPVWGSAIEKVHLTRNRADSGRIQSLIHLHVANLADADVDTVDGLPVTSLARTFVDLARTRPLGEGVAAGDQALRAGMSASDVADQLERAKARRGIGRARRAGGLLDPCSEGAGESISRIVFLEAGLPMPELQVELLDEGGALIARVDFLWREFATVGEFDGKVKYGRLLRPGETAADAVVREKIREDRVRELGLQFVRWTWADAYERAELLRRLQRAVARGKPFRG